MYRRFSRRHVDPAQDAADTARGMWQGAFQPPWEYRRSPGAITYDTRRYRDRHLIENAFCRIKDFRRVATRYDKLTRNFLSTVALATLVSFWL